MKLIQRTTIYIAILLLFAWLNESTEFVWHSMVLLGVILALSNFIIRPIVNVLCLPVSIVTFGIACIFVNMLTIVIANGIMGGVLSVGFWGVALLAVIVMVADSLLRLATHKVKEA